MLIIAPCSSRKRVTIAPGLDASDSQAIDLTQFALNWVTKVRATEQKHTPQNVYAGIGFSASQSAAVCLNAQLQFLSAGMSLVSSSTLIPGYNLTISGPGPTPFTQVKESGNFKDWWYALNHAFGYDSPLLKSISEHDGPVYIALPSNYLMMVENELAEAIAISPNKVRIITSSKMNMIPALSNVAIRYDQRLNTASNGPSGANASFSQRALLNFARIITAHSAQLETVVAQQALVDGSFKEVSNAEKEKRVKVSESHLFTIIQSALAKEQVTRTKLLENLRRSEGIACEQHRFSRVYEQAIKLRA